MSKTWAYGITTVPERFDMFKRTMLSLSMAGFPSPHVFVDGDKDGGQYRAAYPDLLVSTRPTKVRTFGNWLLGLVEVYIRQPSAAYYAMFQDDVALSRNVREYLERCPGPHNTPQTRGYLNLYTFPKNETSPLCPRIPVGERACGSGKVCESAVQPYDPSFVGFYPGRYNKPWRVDGCIPRDNRGQSIQQGLGAVALVFTRQAVWDLLSSRFIVMKPSDSNRGWRSVDGAVVCALNAAGYLEYVHYPSLVQHVGEQSSMGNAPHPRSVSFRGEDFDCLSMLSR
jgi:hypothetical protein